MEKLRMYKCINQLVVEKCDGDGGFTEEFLKVEIGDTFERSNEKTRFIDGEIRLDNEYSWLEIDKETLDYYFEEVTE